MKRFFGILAPLLLLSAFLYVYREPVRDTALSLYDEFAPCSRPLTYSIGAVDARFSLSREDFMGAVREAEAIWEKSAGRDLFSYRENGDVTVSLIYDYRQEAMDKLKALGISIDTNQASYDELRGKYEGLLSDYGREKAALEEQSRSFDAQQGAYNTEVASWNERGGAPKSVYDRLESEKEALTQERTALVSQRKSLNEKVNEINALATTLNKLAASLNIQAKTYNTIGQSTGSEFEEGVYEQKGGVRTIDIYEFASHAELVRVLAHELGHALGLEHVGDADSIMYKMNDSSNEDLTSEDLEELARVCWAAG